MYLQFYLLKMRVGDTVFVSVFYSDIPLSPHKISGSNCIMRISCDGKS